MLRSLAVFFGRLLLIAFTLAVPTVLIARDLNVPYFRAFREIVAWSIILYGAGRLFWEFGVLLTSPPTLA